MTSSVDASQLAADGLRILVPYDGSDTARRAVDFVTQLPARQVTLLHVIPESHLIVPPLTEREKADWLAETAPDLDELASIIANQGKDVVIDIRDGDVASEIVNAARDHDLTVMTTSGKGAAGRVLFGNVADRVSRSAETPTVLLRGKLVHDGVKEVHRIVVPLDGSPLSEHALPLAANLGQRLHQPVWLVRVTDLDTVLHKARSLQKAGQAIPEGEDRYDQALREAIQEGDDYLREKATALQDSGVTVETRCLSGTPVYTLLDALHDDDLVVMTSHGQSGYKRWLLGSVAEKLVREAKSPVLLVPTRHP